MTISQNRPQRGPMPGKDARRKRQVERGGPKTGREMRDKDS